MTVTSRRATAQADLFASVVVFLVAFPLCLGIAQACGLSPEAGIVTGIVGGILGGALAGGPLLVSGPTAGHIVLVVAFLAECRERGKEGPEAVALLGLAIVLAGGLQIAAGVVRLGQWFRAVTPAVVEGMLAGVGLTIISIQFHVMVDDVPPPGILDDLLSIPDAVRKGFAPPPDAQANHSAAALTGAVTIVVLAAWKLFKPRPLKFVPAAVVAIALAIGLNELGGLGVKRVEVSDHILDGLTPIRWPGWELFASGLVWKAAATFALIASAETLLCSVAVDTMHTGPRTRADKELIAQGVGNLVCGAVGALPMTGVIVRSSANVEAGARTRLSTILHGVWLLLFVAFLPGLLSRIPLSALAAVLVYTGWNLVNLSGVVRLWRVSRGEAAIYVATAATVVAADLLTGVVAGVALSAAKLVWALSRLSVRREASADGRRVDLYLEGAGTFLRVPQLAEELDGLPRGSEVQIHLGRLQFVDHAALTLFETFRKQHEAGGGNLSLDWGRPDTKTERTGTTIEQFVERPEPIAEASSWRRDHVPLDPI